MGRAIAHALGAKSKKNGYMEGNGYVVSWCFGHLFGYAQPNEYAQWEGPWDYNKLPMIPVDWKLAKNAGANDQIKILKDLIHDQETSLVINACDADREGELIFRLMYEELRGKKPVKRLWSVSMEDEQIRKDMAAAKDSREYDGLADAALGRARADWIVGMNGSRAYSVIYRKPYSVGRVQTCVLAVVAKRTLENRNFTSRPFWKTVGVFGPFKAETEQFDEEPKAQAAKLAAREAGNLATVTKVESKPKRVKTPELYNLTALQRDASKYFGMAADETLACAQELYEAKLLSYPRTDSRYVGSDSVDLVAALLDRVRKPVIVGNDACRYFEEEEHDVMRVVNDKKVAGHAALTPTMTFTAERYEGLTKTQQQVMYLVCMRLLAATMPHAEGTTTNLELDMGGYTYKATQTTFNRIGHMSIGKILNGKRPKEEQEEDPIVGDDGMKMSAIVEGSTLCATEVEVKEGKTTPPKLYTEETLLSAMENAGQKVEDKELRAAMNDDTSHSNGLGTPATRAEIIKKLITKKYIVRKKKTLVATDEGIQLAELVSNSLKTPERTAKWEYDLSRIEHGEESLSDFMSAIEIYTGELVKDAKTNFVPGAVAFAERPEPSVVGICPKCGREVVRKNKSYQCSSNRFTKQGGKYTLTEGCGFSFLAFASGSEISETEAGKLLAGEAVFKKNMVSQRTKKRFDAHIKLSEEGGRFEYLFPGKDPDGAESAVADVNVKVDVEVSEAEETEADDV
jgi:DNA topoisomerase-3